MNLSEPAIEKVYFRNYNQHGLAPLRNGVKGNNCFAALVTADQGSAIVLKHSFGRILLVALQFAMEFNRNRVEQSPPVDHAVRNLVSFAQFDKLVEESSGYEIISAFLLKTAYLSRYVAYPFAAVVPYLVIGVCKNKPFVEFPLEQGRHSVNRDFDPLGKQDIDILDEHFKTLRRRSGAQSNCLRTIGLDTKSTLERPARISLSTLLSRQFTANQLRHSL